MKKVNEFKFESCFEKHTFLIGDVNTYKTTISANFVQFLLEKKKIKPEDISILDFAPKFTNIDDLKFGGRIADFYEQSRKCNYYLPSEQFIPARLESKNKKELFHNAYHNFRLSEEIIKQYSNKQTPFLIINDASMYLQRGDKKVLLDFIRKTKTFFGNGYYGTSISKDYSKLFNLIEKKRIDFVIKILDKDLKTDIIRTDEL